MSSRGRIDSPSWGDTAQRFEALSPKVSWLSARWDGEAWLVRGGICERAEFVALARLCLAKLGTPVSSDEEACRRWIERIFELPGLERFRDPAPPKACLGIHRLAATLCRRYEAAEAIRALSPVRPRGAAAFPKRQEWLRKILVTRGESAHRFATLKGFDSRTLNKILHGEPVQEATLNKLAGAVDCPVRDIPSD